MIKLTHLLFAALLYASSAANASSMHIGYELGQMASNGFQHVAGEISYSREDKPSVRLSFLNVALSERHLSSQEAGAVDGENVEGLWRGAEALYEYPIMKAFFFRSFFGIFIGDYQSLVATT